MKIKKGKSYAIHFPRVSFNRYNWGVAFKLDKSVESLAEYGHNITHKVFGWSHSLLPYPNDKNRNSFAPHHNNSQRIGFSVGEDGMTVYAYFYNQGEWYREVMASGLDVGGFYHATFQPTSSMGRVQHTLSQSIGEDWVRLNKATSVYNYPTFCLSFTLGFAIGSNKTAPQKLKCKTWITR